MKKFMAIVIAVLALTMDIPNGPTFVETPQADAAIKWVSSSRCENGGYYRDTSNDGYEYNNANYLGYND